MVMIRPGGHFSSSGSYEIMHIQLVITKILKQRHRGKTTTEMNIKLVKRNTCYAYPANGKYNFNGLPTEWGEEFIIRGCRVLLIFSIIAL